MLPDNFVAGVKIGSHIGARTVEHYRRRRLAHWPVTPTVPIAWQALRIEAANARDLIYVLAAEIASEREAKS